MAVGREPDRGRERLVELIGHISNQFASPEVGSRTKRGNIGQEGKRRSGCPVGARRGIGVVKRERHDRATVGMIRRARRAVMGGRGVGDNGQP